MDQLSALEKVNDCIGFVLVEMDTCEDYIKLTEANHARNLSFPIGIGHSHLCGISDVHLEMMAQIVVYDIHGMVGVSV